MRRTEAFAVAALAAASLATAQLLPRPAPVEAGLALAVAWAGLLLYVPVRAAAGWCWRQVAAAAPREADRRALGLVLVLGVGLLAWGIDWGLVGHSWAADELRPDWVRDVLRKGLSSGWYDKYPWLHYAVLAVPMAGFEAAEQSGLLAAGGASSWAAQLAVMRAVSVAMGLATLVAAFLCAVEIVGARRAALAPLVLLLTPLFVFYGKTANLDVPSLCWFAWAMVAFLRIVRRGRATDYVCLAVASAGAVATKDQAYANLALVAAAVLIVTARRETSRTWWGKLGSALAGRQVLSAAAASALALALFHNVIFNSAGAVAHFKLLATLGDLAIVPGTAAGYAKLAGLTLWLFRWSLGWPFFALAVLGIASAAARPERRWQLWLLVVPLSFYLVFTCVTRYVNDRYLFGGIFVLALFAASACADLLAAVRRQPLPRLVAGGACAYSLLYAASINVAMTLDARHAARKWLAARAGAGSVVALVGGPYQPAVPPPARSVVVDGSVGDLARASADYVVINGRFARRYERARSPEGRTLLKRLEDGSLGYDEAFRYRAPLPAWALLQYEAPMRGDEESSLTNLDKVNPEMVVYARRRP
ncbi:MAG TPA: glycosyltransferase family 39 protein [Vicinamibacterales bacterium]|nr:glycosyltransferase family 39 protein [Vicinamibacterales bacterium]HPW19754.1 glycosyltransferase family 39 protein [Vicinamibacterales bacterium]